MLWHGPDTLPPPYKLCVVRWSGREFDAARGMHPTKRRLMWCEVRIRPPEPSEIYWLPPKGKGGWTPEPACWRPKHIDKWIGPLPEPLPSHHVMNLYYERAEFNATEAAREMESDRLIASTDNVSHETVREHVQEHVEKRKWRDASWIKYQSKGEVTLDMTEARVMRAVAKCGAGYDPTMGGTSGAGRELSRDVQTTAALLARLADLADDEKRQETAKADYRLHGVNRFQPLPADHDDFDSAMGWVTALNPPEFRGKRWQAWKLNREQQVLLWRSLDIQLSWGDIGYALGKPKTRHREAEPLSRERCRQIYEAAISKCWRAANGLRVHRHIDPIDQIAALRERNLAFKRRV